MCVKFLHLQKKWFEEPNRQRGFESHALKKLELKEIEAGRVTFTFTVTEDHLNAHGTLHGG